MRAVGHLCGLTVEGDDVRWRIAHRTAANVGLDAALHHGHHRDQLVRRQPIGAVVSAGKVAHIVDVAEEEGHCAEPTHTGPSPA